MLRKISCVRRSGACKGVARLPADAALAADQARWFRACARVAQGNKSVNDRVNEYQSEHAKGASHDSSVCL
jgi:hypothetical protein